MPAAARAHELRRLHADPAILVLVGAWDAASARTVAAVAGCRALATASWALPAGREDLLAAVGAIASAVAVPVMAELDGRAGETPDRVAATVHRAIAAGAAGCTLEDGMPGDASLRDAADAARRVGAARDQAERDGVPIVVTARTDVYLRGADDLEAAVLRGRAYAAAGADCVFVPGVRDAEAIRVLVHEIGVPVAVLAVRGGPSVGALQALGVARVSFPAGPLDAALAALARSAAGRSLAGVPAGELSHRPPAA